MEVKVEGRIHELHEVVKSEELSTHARLVAEKISLLYRVNLVRD